MDVAENLLTTFKLFFFAPPPGEMNTTVLITNGMSAMKAISPPFTFFLCFHHWRRPTSLFWQTSAYWRNGSQSIFRKLPLPETRTHARTTKPAQITQKIVWMTFHSKPLPNSHAAKWGEKEVFPLHFKNGHNNYKASFMPGKSPLPRRSAAVPARLAPVQTSLRILLTCLSLAECPGDVGGIIMGSPLKNKFGDV